VRTGSLAGCFRWHISEDYEEFEEYEDKEDHRNRSTLRFLRLLLCVTIETSSPTHPMSLSSFDSLIASKSLLQHPFYVRWTKGELSMDDMKVYAREYYALVSAIPEVVSIVLENAKTERPEMVEFIQHNLDEEKEHVQLWERFARSMDIALGDLKAYVPSEKMQAAIQDLKDAVSGSLDAGISAVYAFEKELPEIAKTKKEGLIAFYGLTSEDAHVYFDEHLNEEEHLKVWREAAKTADESAILASMTAQNKALDAVCDVAGIECHC